jgi:H+/Cl- antiporter ClcA
MSDSPSGGNWAPFDYTDGKEKGQWKTDYPPDARKCIRLETLYLVFLAGICLFGVFWVIQKTSQSGPNQNQDFIQLSPTCLGFLGALFAGALGGCCFGIKCMYHFVAKRMWHEDRRLWRLLTPPLSGILSLFMVFLVASGLLEIFDSTFIEHPIRVMAFSFLVGYFSDKALAKMAEVADTLFGGIKQ